ncbi:hypothetical protein E5K00_07285 [Hymenobacter aquaticus]|uniref:STAS/SEC14 domain-containing protein n=1 Tax=Hymenobacter aquaticus TaxID=1867101 RepID=A0A4Z0Q5P3_9BACT|nr:hypothetical protein [Hymenobacter aquaticus]TGE24995.1 hypothetical protein E5K00_07285 [Hymenobacter aquaticus]
MSLLPTLSFYTVLHQPSPPLLTGISQRALHAEEITETCEVLLAAAARHHCPYWLLDGRANPCEQPATLHEWMREDYFPRVRAVLGRQPQVAFLVAPNLWPGLPQRGYGPPHCWESTMLHAAWFCEEDPAQAWLRRQRARLGFSCAG